MTAMTTEGRIQSGAVPLRVLDVPSPPFTSLTRAARGAYDDARAQWTESERARLQETIDALLPGLPRRACDRGSGPGRCTSASSAWPAARCS